MSDDERVLSPNDPFETDDDLETLRALDPSLDEHLESGLESMGNKFSPPFDVRVARPRALDLRKLFELTKQPMPPGIEATLGPNVPILLEHVVTPFAADGKAPRGVWALGYEIILGDGVDANTIGVAPNNELLDVGKVDQDLALGIDLGGQITVPAVPLPEVPGVVGFQSERATLKASTNQQIQFSLHMKITLRKLVGGPSGVGGAVWKMYRQDERLDRPHTLVQTLLLAAGTTSIPCTIKTWATQAGLFGTRIGAKTWPYTPQPFEISLAGL